MKPLRNIMEASDFGDAKSYRVGCDCTDPEHDVHMWIEVDSDSDTRDVQLSFYVDTWTPFWDKKFNRFKAAYDILFKGINRQQHHMILSEKAAECLTGTITQAIKDVRAFKQP
jgi:hypothetical protein